MKETTPEEYRAEARRFHDMAAQTEDPVRKVLYRQMERSYLTLAEGQELLSRPAERCRHQSPQGPEVREAQRDHG
jgi:hypothetical protein